jgi:hypothetical protein
MCFAAEIWDLPFRSGIIRKSQDEIVRVGA